jgi:uncharacterized protein YecE (DUF72 family)
VPHPVRIGCSGWVYDSWRDLLYEGAPQRTWLARYAEAFDTVEVNSTFYRLARPASVARWVEATPPAFAFTVKGSRYLTHLTRFRDAARGVRRFADAIAPLRESGKLAATLWQFPERQARDDDLLGRALEALPDGRHAFEFRHPTWFDDAVLDRLRDHACALVVGDHPDRPWQPCVTTAPFSVVRFHHGARGRRGNYSEGELEEWTERVRRLAREAEVFAYFNNDWEGFAVRNARRMRRLGGW